MRSIVIFVCGLALGAYLGHLLASMYAQAVMSRIGQTTERSMLDGKVSESI